MKGYYTEINGNIALINVICYTSQFVAIILVPNESSAILTSHFIHYVLLEFDLDHIVVLNDGSVFKGTFIDMCQALNLNYDVLTKHNHKDLEVEHFHRFFNKSVTIAAENRGTNDVFVHTSGVVGYTMVMIYSRSFQVLVVSFNFQLITI